MKKIRTVVSLFDGISCGQVALNKLHIKYDNYFASEIDKYTKTVTQDNFPNTIQIGDVTKIDGTKLHNTWLLMGGSPCQGFSSAGKKLNFDDPRSKLFFEFVRLKNECNPKFFLYENVVPKDKSVINIISELLHCEPIMINSSLVSAQSRKRLYWTNIPNVTQPIEKGILLKDIVEFESTIPLHEDTINELQKFTKRKFNVTISKTGRIRPHQLDVKKSGISEIGTLTNPADKSVTIIASHTPKTYKSNPFRVYELSRNELEQLQTLPVNYTNSISFAQAKKAIGNGWNINTIAHILTNLPTH